MTYKEPIAVIIESSLKENGLVTVIKFKKMPSNPLAPGWLCNSDKERKPVIDFHRCISKDKKLATFVTYKTHDNIFQPLKVGEKYIFGSMWTPMQLEIAKSDPNQWHEEEFKSKDMLAFRQQDGSTIGRKSKHNEDSSEGIIVHGGWDHEHCELCWKTISTHEDFDHSGYTNGSDWICSDCFHRYILSGYGKKLGDDC